MAIKARFFYIEIVAYHVVNFLVRDIDSYQIIFCTRGRSDSCKALRTHLQPWRFSLVGYGHHLGRVYLTRTGISYQRASFDE